MSRKNGPVCKRLSEKKSLCHSNFWRASFRVLKRGHWFLCGGPELAQKQMNGGRQNMSLAGIIVILIVLAQSAIAAQPGKRPLHFPTQFDGFEPLGSFGAVADLDTVTDLLELHPAAEVMAAVLVVPQHHAQPRVVGGLQLA